MAWKNIVDKAEYQCLSSDSKPMGSDGSTLHIVDTGEVFIWHDGAWEEDRRLLSVLLTYNSMIS